MNDFLRVRNWERYQIYRDGRPALFFAVHVVSDPKKGRKGIFDDPQFLKLANDPACPVFRLMGLAARTGNAIPNDAEWIERTIGVDVPIDVAKLVDAGFLEVVANPHEQTVRTDSYETVRPRTKSREEKNRVEKKERRARGTRTDIETVYAYWRSERGRSNRRYDTTSPARRQKIVARLEEFSVDELCAAIRGVAGDPWTERPQHDDLTIIFRSREQVERFLSFAENPPVSSNGRRGVSVTELQAQAEAAE